MPLQRCTTNNTTERKQQPSRWRLAAPARNCRTTHPPRQARSLLDDEVVRATLCVCSESAAQAL